MLRTEERAKFNRIAIRIAPKDPELALELLTLIEESGKPRVFRSKEHFSYHAALRTSNGPVVSKKPWTVRELRLRGLGRLATALANRGVTDSAKMAKHEWRDVLNWPRFGKAKVTALRAVCDAE